MALPPAILDVASSLLGADCTEKLLVDFNINDAACLKLAVSKLLGVGIIFGAVIVKIPQIIKIVNSRSTKGLSFFANLLETLTTLTNFTYNVRADNPFTTYGETLFITVQNILITLLILFLNRKFYLFGATSLALALFSYAIFSAQIVDDKLMAFLQTSTIPVFLASRLPQIWLNFKAKNTGQLSAISVFLVAIGSIARVFTTLQEVKDGILLLSVSLAAFLNSLIAAQMLVYWSRRVKGNKLKKN